MWMLLIGWLFASPLAEDAGRQEALTRAYDRYESRSAPVPRKVPQRDGEDSKPA